MDVNLTKSKTQLEVMLTCPVCQDIFKDPRQLPCGHSLCMLCLEGMIDFSSDMPFRCPDCRAFFGPVVDVQKSYALANIAEDCRENKKAKQDESVPCDCCQNKELAVKTCLKCEVSLCEEHIKIHYECPAYTGHPLVNPLRDPVNRKCPKHEVLKNYCSLSGSYVCNLCAVDKRDTNLAVEASSALGRKLMAQMDDHFHLLEDALKDCASSVKQIKEELASQKLKAYDNDSTVNSVTIVLLCLWFISVFYAYCYSVENQNLTESLETQKTSLHHIYSTVAEVLAKQPAWSSMNTEEPGILTLDVDSASPYLQVSADLRSVTRLQNKATAPDRASRFDVAPQVLSTRCFSSGTRHWLLEVEGYWDVAVSYRSIQRKGKGGSAFGTNQHSWSLTHNSKGQLLAYHNGSKKVLTHSMTHNEVVVAVDFERGTITFTEAAPTFAPLCEFQATLTQPLCLGIGLYGVTSLSRATVIRVY